MKKNKLSKLQEFERNHLEKRLTNLPIGKFIDI